MLDRIDRGGARFAEVQEVTGYWQALCRDGQPPAREAIDPRGMAGALPQTFLIERVAPGVARFRLAGMHLSDLMGMEVRGLELSSLIDAMQRTAFGQALEAVFAGPATLTCDLEAHRGIGRPALAARMVVLPLRAEGRGFHQALGCLATEGAIGRAPRVFSVARQTVLPHCAAPEPAEMMAGMAEKGEPYTPRRPHLRLVKTG